MQTQSREDDMDCCGHALAARQWMLSTALTSVGAMLASEVGPRGPTAAARTAETTSAALDVLRKSISIDVHTHGGTTRITSKAPPNSNLANGMRAGSLAVACLARRSRRSHPRQECSWRPRCAAYARVGPALQVPSRASRLDG